MPAERNTPLTISPSGRGPDVWDENADVLRGVAADGRPFSDDGPLACETVARRSLMSMTYPVPVPG